MIWGILSNLSDALKSVKTVYVLVSYLGIHSYTDVETKRKAFVQGYNEMSDDLPRR
jgi:hypothetical protein